MNIDSHSAALYYGFLMVLLAVKSFLSFFYYFQTKKRLIQAKKKTTILDLRKKCDCYLVVAWIGAAAAVVLAGLMTASLLSQSS
jgi:hypothetical protein